jgi:hypothetical protein
MTFDNESGVLCKACGKTFYHNHTFEKHYRERHEQTKEKNECEICQKEFKNKIQLKNHHVKTHTTKKCDECDVEVSTGAFGRHMTAHKNKTEPSIIHQCGNCTKIFTRKEHLTSHEKKCGVMKEKVRETSRCNMCRKEFAENRYLKAHMSTHELKLPNLAKTKFQCEYCSKEFSTKYNMSIHIQKKHPNPEVIHHENVGYMILDNPSPPKPTLVEHMATIYNCEYCEYESGKSSNVERHVKLVHMTTPTQIIRGRKAIIPSTWSENTKMEYARREKRSFKNRIKDMELEEFLEEKDENLSKMTEKEVINIIGDFDISDRKMLKLLTRLRTMFGQKAFTPNIRDALIERKKSLTKFFKREEIKFEGTDGEELTRQFVYTEDLEILIDFICHERTVEKSTADIAIGMDSGMKRLIVTLTVIDGEENDNEEKFKDTSTKRVIVLAHVDDIPENYANMSIILEKLNIHMITNHYQIVSDLKLNNIILGLMQCSARYGCCYCKGKKGDDGVWTHGPERTLESLVEDQKLWEDNSGIRAELKEYYNVEHKPLLHASNNQLLSNNFSTTSTLVLLPPPGLHTILLGPVNHLWKALGKQIDLTPFEILFKLVKNDRQKKEFQGPQCKKVLRNLNNLKNYLDDEKLHIFVDAFESIAEIYKLSHATSVDINHREKIMKLEITWKLIMRHYKITMPLKIHIIIHHLSDYFERTSKTLRNVTDQVVESSHHKVRQFFDLHPNYNHIEKESKEAGEAILAGIIHFNSNNLSTK